MKRRDFLQTTSAVAVPPSQALQAVGEVAATNTTIKAGDLIAGFGDNSAAKSLSRFRFDEPFFYGHFDDLVWIVMSDRAEGIRFTHSPSGGGADAERRTTNPAWDLQFLIPDPEVGKDYGFKVRSALRPRCSREEILAEFKKGIEGP
jgi:hypothetical protein